MWEGKVKLVHHPRTEIDILLLASMQYKRIRTGRQEKEKIYELNVLNVVNNKGRLEIQINSQQFVSVFLRFSGCCCCYCIRGIYRKSFSAPPSRTILLQYLRRYCSSFWTWEYWVGRQRYDSMSAVYKSWTVPPGFQVKNDPFWWMRWYDFFFSIFFFFFSIFFWCSSE